MPNEHLIETVRGAIEWAAMGIEVLGALVIVAGVLRVAVTRGTIRFLFKLDEPGAFGSYKQQMGRSLLLGLEFLIAGDVVRTVAAGTYAPQRFSPGAPGARTDVPELVPRRRDRRSLAMASAKELDIDHGQSGDDRRAVPSMERIKRKVRGETGLRQCPGHAAWHSPI
jgi:uncharacterized membrane protein